MEKRMPAIFIGHGNPVNAITDNLYRRKWIEIGGALGKPKAILCISAHWITEGTYIHISEKPQTIHDFLWFPKEMYAIHYPVSGAPELAKNIVQHLKDFGVKEDNSWGLDHGCWSPLISMFPAADIPVFQMSVDYKKSLKEHYEFAKHLKYLRDEGILIIGSGNIVHNLVELVFEGAPNSWALEFDSIIKDRIKENDMESIFNFEKYGNAAKFSVPTLEHFIPLIYILGVRDPADKIKFFNESIDLSSVSMTSFILR